MFGYPYLVFSVIIGRGKTNFNLGASPLFTLLYFLCKINRIGFKLRFSSVGLVQQYILIGKESNLLRRFNLTLPRSHTWRLFLLTSSVNVLSLMTSGCYIFFNRVYYLAFTWQLNCAPWLSKFGK